MTDPLRQVYDSGPKTGGKGEAVAAPRKPAPAASPPPYADRLREAADALSTGWDGLPAPPDAAAAAALLRAVAATSAHQAGTPGQAASVVLAQAAASDLADAILGGES